MNLGAPVFLETLDNLLTITPIAGAMLRGLAETSSEGEKPMDAGRKTYRGSLLVLSIVLAAAAMAGAQAGQLDASFGTGGIVTTDFGNQINSNIATASAVTIQSDGKILVCGGIPSGTGFPVAAIARYNTDGSLDSTFGSSGIVVTSNLAPPGAITVQSDGKIVVAGPTGGLEINVARYTSAGSLDPTFGTGGIFTTGLELGSFSTVSTVVIQPDGKILVADGILLRLLANGQIDSSFGTAGVASVIGSSAGALALLPGGKILVSSGISSFISRYKSNGSLDTTFAINGQLASPGPANALLLLNTGDFVVNGSLTSSLTGPTTGFAVSRYLGMGVTDGSFATHGGVVTPVPGFSTVSASGLNVQSSGDIVAAGTATVNFTTVAFALARYTSAGKLDTTFGSNGTVTTSFGTTSLSAPGLAIQADGKIVAVAGFTTTVPHGEFDTGFKVVRYLGQ